MRLSADIGGTFTDVVAYDPRTGQVAFAKAPSTPDDPVRGVIDAIGVLAQRTNETARDLLARADGFVHGTTVATNTLAERNGPLLGLITTRGFRDVLELREGTKENRYALRTEFPDALISREMRIPVSERIHWDGSVAQALAEQEVIEAVATLKAAGATAIVVGMLHAHVNPAHELRAREIILAAGWTGLVVLSHEIYNRQGEYARFSTAAVNAYVTPRLAAYVERLRDRLNEGRGNLPVMVVQSSGGLLPVETVSRFGVGSVTSGPAGGAIACTFLAHAIGSRHAVTFDIGGTTTDISLIEDGRPVERAKSQTDAYTIAVPSIDITVYAIGGGSIASVDAGGVLSVGPQSSGANPGPAAYARGGTRATVTDAAVVLGYLTAGQFSDGRLSLSRELATEAIRRDIAEPLALTVEEAARAVYQLAATKVAEGVRAATVGRGTDPRDLDLIAFGGAGGLYIDSVARELEMERAIAPRAASVFSAFGFLAAQVRFDEGRTLAVASDAIEPETLRDLLAQMRGRLAARLAEAGFAAEHMQFDYRIECRYARQLGTVEVELSPGEDDPRAAVVAAFEAKYESLYAHRHQGQACVFEACRVIATGTRDTMAYPQVSGMQSSKDARMGSRDVYAEGTWASRPVYSFELLAPGEQIPGPALLESTSTTLVIEAGSVATVDAFGSIVITRPSTGESV